MIEESADRASMCLFFAQRSRVAKTPALSALPQFGGRVGGGDCAGAGELFNGFAEPGNVEWVDCHDPQGRALLSPFYRI